jgi:hypothetical protein
LLSHKRPVHYKPNIGLLFDEPPGTTGVPFG